MPVILCHLKSFALMPCTGQRLIDKKFPHHLEAPPPRARSLSSFSALLACMTWGFGVPRAECPLTGWLPSSAWKKLT